MRSLVFCITCRHSVESRAGPDGRTGGETLAHAMEGLLLASRRTDVRIERQSCLWSCTRHCNVLIRDTERYSYLAGGFAPGPESAEAILAWFDLHGETATGE